jgi:hypothetical protein
MGHGAGWTGAGGCGREGFQGLGLGWWVAWRTVTAERDAASPLVIVLRRPSCGPA